jgi:MoaA/NifB/PqqE/SkfB family radical SAM enzyme
MGHLDRVDALNNGHKRAPVNVEIDLSNRCSLGCEWCHFAHTHTRGPHAHARTVDAGDLLDTRLALRALEEMRAYGVRSVTWSGGGEPTLHPDFDHLIAMNPLPQGIYTHGGHIDANRARLLKQRLRFVYISLDAVSAAQYSQCKGVPPTRFQDVLDGVGRLIAADGAATIGLGFLLNADNYQDASAMYALGQRLGVDYVQFRPTIRYKADAPGEIEGDVAWVDAAMEELRWLAGRPGVEIDLQRFEMLRDWQGHPYPTCWWSGLQTVITPDGRLWACLNKRGYAGAALGDLHTESFADIWARAPIQQVNGACRVMCRGHLPNLALDEMLAEREHGEFI